MAYTYKDFERQARDAGLYDSFSAADLNLAQSNPAAGLSILSAKQQYGAAQTDTGKALANKRAEEIRASYGGYTGGGTGAYYNLEPLSPGQFEKQDKYGGAIDELLGAMGNREKFSYDVAADPLYQQYRKEYLREGQRAMQDTMGQAAAMTGGRPSSYAVTAANLAGNYYSAQLTDKIPELYNQAYNRYLQEFQMQQQQLQALQGQQKADYGRLVDEVADQRARRDEASQARQEQFNRAQVAYELGDARMLNELGIDTANDLNRQFTEMQLQQQGWQNELAKAQAAANYGDYSLLEKMGFDTSRANFDRDLAVAQLIASITGDTSELRALLRNQGYNVPESAPAASYGGSSGGGYSGGGGSGGGSGSTGQLNAQDITAALAYAEQQRDAGIPVSAMRATPPATTRQEEQPKQSTTGKYSALFSRR